MATLTEKTHAGEFILSELDGAGSRSNVTLLGGTTNSGKLYPGTVLGKLTVGGKYVPSPATGADGSQTGVAILIGYADVTDADVEAAVIDMDAEVNGNSLIYDSSVDSGGKITTKNAELLTKGIKVR